MFLLNFNIVILSDSLIWQLFAMCYILDHLFKNEAEIYTFQYLIKNEKLHIYLHTIISNENLINFKRKIDDYLKFKATNYVLEIISKPYKSIAGKLL